MASEIPTIRQHKRGYYFVRWGGRDHYLSRDLDEATKIFHDSSGKHDGALVNWLRWQDHKRDQREAVSRRRNLRVVDVAKMWLESYADEGRTETVRYQRKQLARFLNVFGALPIEQIDVGALRAFRTDLMKMDLSPTTVGHDIGSIKTFLAWAADHELAPVLNLRVLKKPPREHHPVRVLGFFELTAWMHAAHKRDPNLAAHLALNYLGLMRPSEVLRLVRGEGEFIPVERPDGTLCARGVFRFEVFKTQHRSNFPRHVMLTDQALHWLSLASPAWGDEKAYSKRVRQICGKGGPKLIQKAAGNHLIRMGEKEGDVDRLLGHWPSGAWRSYLQVDWRPHWARAARLAI